MRRLLVLLATVTALTACTQASAGEPVPAEDPGMPADFVATVVYRNGSVPPPHHYEWRLRVDASSARLRWQPGYDDAVEPWVEEVEISQETRAAFYDRLRAAGAFADINTRDDGLAGGPTGSTELLADGRTYRSGTLGSNEESSDLLKEIHAAAQDVLPAEVWTELADRQQQRK